MVTTRKKRPVTYNEEELFRALDFQAEEEESVLAHKEEQRMVRQKKRRLEQEQEELLSKPGGTRWLETHPPVETLPTEVWQRIFLYMENAKTLYTFAVSTNNRHLAASLNDEAIVKAGIYSGGHTHTATKKVLKLVENRAIFVPSMTRLFRLINGVYCERGEDCFEYNLVTKKPAHVHPAYRPFGLCICHSCTLLLGAKVVHGNWQRRNDHVARQNKQIALASDDTSMLTFPQFEKSTGDKIGSVFFATDIKQILVSYKKKDEQEQALATLFEQRDADLRKTDESSYEQDTLRAKSLGSLATEADNDLQRFTTAKQKLIDNKRLAENVKKSGHKLAKLREIYSLIQEEIGDDYAHKVLALNCVWQEPNEYSSYVNCCFQNEVSGIILTPLFNAPSRATPKKITATVEYLKNSFDLLHGKGLLQDGFLSFFNQKYRAEKALRSYIVTHYPSWKDIVCLAVGHHYHTYSRQVEENLKQMLDGIREKGSKEWLCGALDDSKKKQSFVDRMLKGEVDFNREREFGNLARRCWDAKHHIDEHYTTALEKYKRRFLCCSKMYQKLRGNFLLFLEDPATVTFMSDTSRPEYRAYQSLTRRRVVHIALEKGLEDMDELLRSPDNFKDLRDFMARIFANPQNFGLSIHGH